MTWLNYCHVIMAACLLHQGHAVNSGRSAASSLRLDGDIPAEELKLSSRLASKMAAMESEIQRLSAAVNQLRGRMTGRSYHCGFQDSWTAQGEVTFDSILLSENEYPQGGLDITSGLYEAPVTGVYEVTVSGECASTQNMGCNVDLYMQDELLDDNFLNSANTNGGPIVESVASSRLVRLIDYQLLFLSSSGAGELRNLKFCVSLLYVE